jgi:hypothetical protein
MLGQPPIIRDAFFVINVLLTSRLRHQQAFTGLLVLCHMELQCPGLLSCVADKTFAGIPHSELINFIDESMVH